MALEGCGDAVKAALRAYGILLAYFVTSFVFFKFLLPYVFPFVLALFLASLIDPLVNRLEAVGVPRGIGSAAVIIVIVAALGVGTVLAVTRLGMELIALSGALPAVYVNVAEAVNDLAAEFGRFSATLPPALRATLNQQLGSVYHAVQTMLTGLLGIVQAGLQAVPAAGMVALITAIATYFISRDKAAIRRFILGMFPREWRRGVVSVKTQLLLSTIGLLKAQTILVLITFVVILAGLTAMRVPYALSTAVASSLLDVIPVLGPALIFIPWSVYAFLQGSVGLALSLLLLYGGVSIVRAIAQAYVVGEKIGLHPLATLLALYLGVTVYGPAGFIYGPLTVIVLKAAMAAGLLPAGLDTGEGDAADGAPRRRV